MGRVSVGLLQRGVRMTRVLGLFTKSILYVTSLVFSLSDDRTKVSVAFLCCCCCRFFLQWNLIARFRDLLI